MGFKIELWIWDTLVAVGGITVAVCHSQISIHIVPCHCDILAITLIQAMQNATPNPYCITPSQLSNHTHRVEYTTT
jgi:hypothetical protein